MVFINQGQHIAVGSRDRNIYIHEVSSGKFLHALSGHKASICSLFNFGNFFASGGDNGCGNLILWDPEQFRMKQRVALHLAALTCIADLTDGTHLATGGYDKKIQVFNYRRGEPAFEVNSCRSGVTCMVVCEQSKKLVSAGLDSTLTVWALSIKVPAY
jgi:WD40 repeat protein